MPGHVLVTGGTGFIGSHLTARLLRDGYEVFVTARRMDTPTARALTAAGAHVITADLVDWNQVAACAAAAPFEAIFHLGANLSMAGEEVHPTNVAGTAHVLRLAEETRAGYLLFASSIEAQGLARLDEVPLEEGRECLPPTPYGASKAEGESLSRAFAERTGIPTCVARIGNTYGPGGLGFVHFFLRALLTDDQAVPALPAIGGRLLQPIFVADLVEALVRALHVRLTGTYNFTGNAPRTIAEWMQALADLLGVEALARHRLGATAPTDLGNAASVPEVAYFLLRDGERIHRAYSDARLRAAIGDYQRHDLHRGLAATLAWFERAGALEPLLQ
jgi:nucleoside-diphosphate-sugar epimerase